METTACRSTRADDDRGVQPRRARGRGLPRAARRTRPTDQRGRQRNVRAWRRHVRHDDGGGCYRSRDGSAHSSPTSPGSIHSPKTKPISAQALPSLTVVRGAPLPRRRCRGWPKPASGLSGATRQANVQLSRSPHCMRSDSPFPAAEALGRAIAALSRADTLPESGDATTLLEPDHARGHHRPHPSDAADGRQRVAEGARWTASVDSTVGARWADRLSIYDCLLFL